MKYLLNILIAIYQLINTLIGGYPDETLSASAYLGEREGKVRFTGASSDRSLIFYSGHSSATTASGRLSLSSIFRRGPGRDR